MKTANHLFERFRPATFDDVAAQPDAVRTCKALLAKNALGGRAVLITGNSGTGKSTLAGLLADGIAAPWNVYSFSGKTFNMDAIREAEKHIPSHGLPDATGKDGKVWIIEELHYLSSDVLGYLLVLLEHLPSHCAFIFTMTSQAKELKFDGLFDSKAFLSRCLKIELSRRDLCEPMADAFMATIEAAGMNGVDRGWAVRTLKDCGNNFRALWEEYEERQLLEV